MCIFENDARVILPYSQNSLWPKGDSNPKHFHHRVSALPLDPLSAHISKKILCINMQTFFSILSRST